MFARRQRKKQKKAGRLDGCAVGLDCALCARANAGSHYQLVAREQKTSRSWLLLVSLAVRSLYLDRRKHALQ
jgi:hypothetical protein